MKKFILLIAFILSLSFSALPQGEIKDADNSDKPCAIRLKVEFLSSGKIGNVALASNSCNNKDFDQQAIDAARKIKFEPQTENEKPTTITKTVEYTFTTYQDEKAEAIIKRAVEKLGGDRYLQIKTLVSTGNFTQFRDGMADIPNGFIDVIVFPDKERTEFKQMGNKIVQTNFGETGWLYDAGPRTVREQSPAEIENYKQGLRTSLDGLLRGTWRGKDVKLAYVGKREAGIGKRNEVIKLIYADGFAVEFEFDAPEGMPVKAVYKDKDGDNIDAKHEERYAQFVNVQGVLTPFIVDRFIDGKQQSRINYLTIELNKPVPDAIFTKPTDVKELKKDLKI